MSYSLQQVIDVACGRAGLADGEALAESLLEQAVSEAADYYTSDEARASVLTETKSLSLASGSATLSGDVYLARISQARLYDPADLTKRYTYVRQWDDFADDAKDLRQGYWTVKGQTLYAIEPQASYEEGDGATIDLKLTCLTSPDVPATASATWDEPDEVVETVIEVLAGMLMPKAEAAG